MKKIFKSLKKFLKSLFCFLLLTKYGFYFSDNTHAGLGTKRWGFIRFNFDNHKIKEFAIFDVDFEDNLYYHLHGGKKKNISLFRLDFNEKEKKWLQ